MQHDPLRNHRFKRNFKSFGFFLGGEGGGGGDVIYLLFFQVEGGVKTV